MAKGLNLPGVGGATGIVAVMFLMGVTLIKWEINYTLGINAIKFSLVIAAIYSILGIFGILKKGGYLKWMKE